MFSEPLTLYKLMILYMLKQVKFPLTNAQISDFFLGHEYTTYFTLQQAFSELLEAHLIKMETVRHSSRYEITREGEDTLSFFGNKISEAIVEDMDAYLKENKVRLRDEVGVVADYYKTTAQDYTVHCEVREGKNVLFEINVTVPSEDQAEAMCGRWRTSNQAIYAFIMKELLREES
jgi:hypothetical protein